MRSASFYGGPSRPDSRRAGRGGGFLVHGWHRGALLVVMTLAGAGLLNWLLKLSFARVRPEAFFDYPLPGSPSFPSGHALYAASVFGGLAALLTARIRNTTPCRIVRLVCGSVLLILLVGSRGFTSACTIPAMCSPATRSPSIWVTSVALGDRLGAPPPRRAEWAISR